MSKLCPSCKREIPDSEQFCPFCAAFTGEKEDKNNKKEVKEETEDKNENTKDKEDI